MVATVALVTVVTSSTATAQSDGGELFDVGGGRRMYLECRGEGGPTVVFESGYPNDGTVWSTEGVFEAVAGFTRACVYDRPGTETGDHRSRSDPAPQPRTAADVVTDLHTLLDAAGESGPYVLVAHSIGGFFVRLFGTTYPDETAGLVLVDTSSEYQIEELTPVTPPELVDSLLLSSQNPPPEVLAANPQIERILFEESATQVRVAQADRPLRPMPLVVLTHGIPVGEQGALPPSVSLDGWDPVLDVLQRRFLQLAPGARQVIATESGHYIQLSQPELVVDATRAVVDAVRRGDTQVSSGRAGRHGQRALDPRRRRVGAQRLGPRPVGGLDSPDRQAQAAEPLTDESGGRRESVRP